MTDNETPLVRVWLRGKFVVKLCKEGGTEVTIANATWANTYAHITAKNAIILATTSS
jgi:hypothetical protein